MREDCEGVSFVNAGGRSAARGDCEKSERKRGEGACSKGGCECDEGEGEKARESRARITNSDGGGEVAACTMLERETRKLN